MSDGTLSCDMVTSSFVEMLAIKDLWQWHMMQTLSGSIIIVFQLRKRSRFDDGMDDGMNVDVQIMSSATTRPFDNQVDLEQKASLPEPDLQV